MKRVLSLILAAALLISLIPAVSLAAEKEDSYVFKMYGNNFTFTASDNQVGDNAQFKDSSTSNMGYLTYSDGAYISAAGSNYYGKGTTSANMWTAAVNIKNSTVNGVALTSNTYVPRIRIATKQALETGTEYGITFKFKVGAAGVAKKYAITTETYKREFCGTTSVYANGTYLGTINDYVESSSSKGVNLSSFDAVELTPDNDGYISLYFRAEGNINEYGSNLDFLLCCVTFTPETTIEYKDVTHTLYSTELVGREIEFTAQINTSDGVFVPEKTGDGLAVTTDNNDVAEVVDATYKDGIYSAKLRTKTTGKVNINFTATVDETEHQSVFKLEVIESPEPYEISVSFDKDAWNGLSAPSEITYLNSNRTIEWIGSSSTNDTKSGWSGDHAFFNLGKGKYAAYQMYLPAEGEYTLKLDYAQSDSKGAIADVYLIPGIKTDIASAMAGATPVFDDINCFNEAAPGTVSTDTRFDITDGGAYTLVFVCDDASNGTPVRIEKLTLTPYIEPVIPEYSETVVDMPSMELVGKEVSFTAKMMMTTGEVYVPAIEGDGISATVLNSEVAEIIYEKYENGVYTATLKTLSAGNARICISSTYEGSLKNDFCTVEVIDIPELAPITIEMTKNTMVFEDNAAPGEDWQTEGFDLVLDKDKMTDVVSRYTNRTYNGTTFVQLQTGRGVWPTLSNAMFTIRKRILTPGWYSVDAKGLVLENKLEADYSIYVNGNYAGDFVLADESVTASSGRYIKEEKLNTVYLPEGYNEISFRARRLNAESMGYFAPYAVTFTPAAEQSELTVDGVSSDLLVKLPIGETQTVTAHIRMSDGSYRHFGLANDGTTDSKNQVISVVSDDAEVMSVSDFVAPQFGEEESFTFKVSANKVASTTLNITANVDGEEYILPVEVEVIETPVLETAVLVLEKSALYTGRTVGTELSLFRSGDAAEFTGEYEIVEYRSSDKTILSVDNGGYVTGIAAGTASVYVDVRDKSTGDIVTGELKITVLEVPEIFAVTVEMTKNTMVFADRTAPSEAWQTDGFELVLDKMTTATSRYTDRKYGNTTFVDLFTGKGVWPTLADGMFTIKKEIIVPGWYSVSMKGLPLNSSSDYAIYVDGRYAGDFVFYDENVVASTDRYLKDAALNTLYLDNKDVEISFRARNMYSNASATFSPHSITFTPLEDQNAVKYEAVETGMSSMLPVGEEEMVNAQVRMSDGSLRQFGLADNGKADEKNQVVSIATEDTSVAEITEWSAPQVGAASDITYTVKAKKTGSTNVVVTVTVDGVSHVESFPLDVIEKPVLSSVEVVLGNEAIPATRTITASAKLVRSGDFKEYAYEVKSVAYSSSDISVAEIDAQTGEITAKKEGTATIYVAVTDWTDNVVTGEKQITVVPKPILAEIKVDADTELLVGGTSQIAVEAIMDDGLSGDISKYALEFASSDTSVAEVSESGVITAVGSGKSTVSVLAINEDGKRCVGVLDVTVYGSLESIVIDFAKTSPKLDYSQPDVTPGYTILTNIGVPKQYRIFDCYGTDMLSVRTGDDLWPQILGSTKSSFAFAIDVPSEGDYGIELYGGEFYSLANYSIYVNGEYAGDYIFYDAANTQKRKQGEKKTLNTLHLNGGYNEVVILLRETPVANQSYMLLKSFTFTPREETVVFEELEATVPSEMAVGEKVNLDAKVRMSDGTYRHFGPDYDSGELVDSDNGITLADSDGLIEIEKHTKIGDTSKSEFTLTAEKAGETVLTYTVAVNGVSYAIEYPVTVKDDPIVSTGAIIHPEELFDGDSVYLYAAPKLKSGRVIESGSAEHYFVSKNKDIATIDGNVLTAHKTGTVTVEVTTVFNGNVVKGTTDIEVQDAGMTSVIATAGGSKIIRLTDKEYDSVPLYITATDNRGNEMDLSGATVVAETISDTVILDGNNEIFPQSEGDAVFNITVTLPNGRMRSTSATLRVSKGKSTSTYYTPEEIATARENYKTLDWVKSTYASYIANADKYVDRVDELYDLIPSEGIPRAICLGEYTDPLAYVCRFCNTDLMAKFGQFPWLHDPLQRPWKMQCPECKRLFPSNDFESFYELGLNEYREFDRQRALDKHAEMFGDKSAPVGSDAWYGYGVKGGYLYNELYESTDLSKVTTLNGGQGLRSCERQETWGVDDGYGYAPKDEFGNPLVNDNGTIERHTYIAEYVHFGLWRQSSYTKSGGVIRNAIRYCSFAYLYTGDIKYGRVAAILLDRVADVYPDLDIAMWNDEYAFANTDGGKDKGKRVGSIWECEEVQQTGTAYDLVFDVYDDPFVVEYLSNKSKEIKMRHAKNTPSQIRTNIEDGFLRSALAGLRTLAVSGNFGLPQKANAICAVVLDNMPETAQWLDYLLAPGWTSSSGVSECPGGGVLEVLMNKVDADGQGDEGSNYNQNWNLPLVQIQEILDDYSKYDKANLLNNPKLLKMLYANIPLMTGYYTPQIGDSGTTAGTGHWMNSNLALAGWRYIKDPVFAQVLYYLNGNTAKGLHYSETEKNPNRLETEVKNVIEEFGDLSLTTDALPNFGYSVLRSGKDYSNTVGETAKDVSRDVWMYFGYNSGHGHRDTLNIGMRAFGLNYMPDHGYPKLTSTDPESKQWTRATITHNTVLVNEEEQTELYEQRGQILHLNDDGNVKVMDVTASYVYDAVDEYRRTVMMIDAGDDVSYTVDFFRVLGGHTHTYSLHASSNEIAETAGLTLTPQMRNGAYSGTYAGIDVPHGNDPGTNSGTLKYPTGYSWLKNVDRDENPENVFEVDFKIKDFNKVIKDSSGLHLRMTVFNGTNVENGADADVAIADGLPPQAAKNKNVDKLKYVLLRNRGNNLNTVFTTIFEPYRNKPYIKESKELVMLPVDGKATGSDAARAVKVTHVSGRVDYVFYATNVNVTYKVVDELENGENRELLFRGFTGVYTLNDAGENIYRVVNDGDIIGEAINGKSAIEGIVKSFTLQHLTENEIRILPSSMPSEKELEALRGKYVVIDNGALTRSGTYKIEDAHIEGDDLVLDIGRVTLIRKYLDASDTEAGYVYSIAIGQAARIPLMSSEDNAPEFDEIDTLTVSAGSSIKTTLKAQSPLGRAITYKAELLPRGASVNSDTGVVTWKPDSSQVGDNHFAVTAQDSDGRESTIHFIITVYGSTTGSSSSDKMEENNKTETPSTESGGTPAGGGGGGAAPETLGNTTETDTSDEKDNAADTSTDVESGDFDGPQFTDLSDHPWATDSINELADAGIIKGTTASTYSPANNITRADFALLLVRAFNLTSDNTENFADVSASDYFATGLAIARNNGIVGGIGENKFAPRNTITRQDMMVIVYRALQNLNVGFDIYDEPQYDDYATVADYAKEAVSVLIGTGLVNGKNGHIAPIDYTTRAEVAVLIKRILNYTNR